jgi:hypothetical protein
MGFHDFAGSASIHLVGGTSGFWGAKILGRRYGYHKDALAKHHKTYTERQNSVDFDDHEFKLVLETINVTHH